MVTKIRHSIQSASRLLAGLLMLACAQAAEVRALLDTKVTATGDAVELTIRASGGKEIGEPVIPDIKGLTIRPQGKSQQMSIVNGRVDSSVAFNYIIGSHVAGEYQIPPIEVTVDGRSFHTAPLELTVRDNGRGAALPSPEELAQEANDPDRFGSLTLELMNQDRKHIYLGEIAPVRIRAWLPAEAQAQLRTGIQPEGQAFTLHNVSDNPQQTIEIKEGKQFRVITWFGGISGTKSGTYPASLSVKATVSVPDRSKPTLRPRRRSPFDDPFFRGMGGGLDVAYISKEVTLSTRDQELELRPLPDQNRPADFSGAVGRFEFDGMEIPTQWRTGEPQRVALRIKGKGNFAVMNAPALTPEPLWKIYPGQDQFTPGDQASFSGSKIFQYNALPRQAGSHQAGFSLSYFDPELAQYQTIKSPARTITVEGSNLPPEQAKAAPSPTPAPTPPPASADTPAPPHQSAGAPRSLAPLTERPLFRWWLAIAGTLFLAGPLVTTYQKLRTHPERLARAAAARATSQAIREAKRCAAASNITGFFEAARLALQHQLARKWRQTPQAITLADVQSHLPADSPVTAFFREADRISYGTATTPESLPAWQELLKAALQSLSSPTAS